jgi:hypothetical protein
VSTLLVLIRTRDKLSDALHCVVTVVAIISRSGLLLHLSVAYDTRFAKNMKYQYEFKRNGEQRGYWGLTKRRRWLESTRSTSEGRAQAVPYGSAGSPEENTGSAQQPAPISSAHTFRSRSCTQWIRGRRYVDKRRPEVDKGWARQTSLKEACKSA